MAASINMAIVSTITIPSPCCAVTFCLMNDIWATNSALA
jgi:hypothetical protein